MPNYIGLPVRPHQRSPDSHFHSLISYPDLGDRSKRQALMYKELCLTNFLPLGVLWRRMAAGPILAKAIKLGVLKKQIPIDLIEVSQVVKDPPAFPEDIANVRRRVADRLGRVKIAKLAGSKHPVVERLFARDKALREKHRLGNYSWEKPVFDGKSGERRLRFLNSLFLAVAKYGGNPEVSTREGLRISLKVHHETVFIKLDRATSPRTNRRGAATGKTDDALRFAICGDYDRTVETAFWQDGEAGRIEDLIKDIAVEVITSAEVDYRATCVHAFEWRVRRKAELEEAARQHELELERRALERRRQREQDRIDRLLDEAAALRKATEIRAYVSAVRSLVANKSEASGIDEWARWALDQAARIDPVENGRYALAHEDYNEITEIFDEDANEAEGPENYVGCNEGPEISKSE